MVARSGMRRARGLSATPRHPVLFVSIGWGERYDGTEVIVGNHRWLTENGSNCSEMYAFKRDGGEYRCGIGSGAVDADRLDVVFVARRRGHGPREVVGFYLDARVEDWNETNDWKGAVARKAYRFPPDQRPVVKTWPGQMSMRRWAFREGPGRSHPALLDMYRLVVAQARGEHVPRESPVDGAQDEELAAFEGELRRRFVLHRSRERSLRNSKLQEVFEATGRLACEVPGCGFDFHEVYGELGHSYAQVHHKKPLATLRGRTKTRTTDLAIVCANCHAMIHRGGACRRLEQVRPRAAARRRKARGG